MIIKRIITIFLIVLLFILAGCLTESTPKEENKTTSTVLPDENEHLIGDNNSNIPNYNINKTNGSIIFWVIPGIIDRNLTLGDLFLEFRLPYIDNAYRMKLHTLTDEYELILKVPEETSISEYLDYATMSLDIRNIRTDELVHNPTDKEVLADFWIDSYLRQREQWKDENIDPKFKGNFVGVLNPDDSGSFIYINIPDELANQIVNELKSAEEKIKVLDYSESDKEFISMGLEIFLEDMGYEFSVLMWINEAGIKAIGNGGEYIPVSEKAYDMVVDLIAKEIDWNEGCLPQLNNISSIELVHNGVAIGIVTNSNEINQITSMLSKSKCCVGGSSCPFNAELVFIYNDGEKSIIRLSTDSCPIIVVGSSIL